MRVVEPAGHKIGDSLSCFVIFEAGPTHNGLASALKLIDHAADSGTQAIKFQILDADRFQASINFLNTQSCSQS